MSEENPNELYDREWEQFINMGYQGSFTDWLIERMTEIERLAQTRLDRLSERLRHIENQAGAQQRVQVLERELESLRHQMQFERTHNAAAPNFGHPRPDGGVTAPPPVREIRPGPLLDPLRGRDAVREQERVEEIRRSLERLQGLTQDSDSG